MREIKFRVHDADTGEVLAYEHFNTALNWGYYWLDAKELAEKGGEAECHAPTDYFKHPSPFGRLRRVLYTGLHDKNGKEIWEGDIVKYTVVSGGNEHLGTIVFEYGAFLLGTANVSIFRSIEVIGNIYENPELLKDIENAEL